MRRTSPPLAALALAALPLSAAVSSPHSHVAQEPLPATAGALFDAVRLDWNGTGAFEWALLTRNGLFVLDTDGAVLAAFPAALSAGRLIPYRVAGHPGDRLAAVVVPRDTTRRRVFLLDAWGTQLRPVREARALGADSFAQAKAVPPGGGQIGQRENPPRIVYVPAPKQFDVPGSPWRGKKPNRP